MLESTSINTSHHEINCVDDHFDPTKSSEPN